ILEKAELKAEFEKNETIRKAEQEKQEVLMKEENAKQRTILIFVSCFLVLVAFLAVVIFRSLRVNQQKNKIITAQKHLVEEKQKEILESITYAKRLQQAILPPQEYI